MHTINEKLKELRKKNNFTQSEVAQKLQLTRPTYNAYEQNICEPNIDTLIKLADFYHTSIDYLVGRKTELINLNGIKPTKKRLILDILNMNELQEYRAQSYFDGLFQR